MTILALPVSSRDHIQGSMTAAITLVMYGDYQCPYCAEANRVIPEIQKQLSEKLCFVFRHFPRIELHPYAQNAAEAAEAAAQQGKFWEMHDCLIRKQPTLDNASLVECAVALGLNITQFLHEVSQDIHAERVLEDIDSGIHSGVKQTPTFFINSRRYDGTWDQCELMAALVSSDL